LNSIKLIFKCIIHSIIRFQNSQSNVPAKQEDEQGVKPFRFSPFQEVSWKTNKVDYALARLDDLLNFARRVSFS
jgi:hypothetical protein